MKYSFFFIPTAIGTLFLGSYSLKALTHSQVDNNTSCPPASLERVAHAGGGYENQSYTNSLEALDHNYQNGFRFFELDFELTSDQQLVLIHDWNEQAIKFFNKPDRVDFSFFNQYKNQSLLTLLTPQDLANWITNHPDIYIITDVKRQNLKNLTEISQRFPKLKKQIIPQIYNRESYKPVKQLGFCTIILTLYASNINDNDVIEFAQHNELFAITMPKTRALSTLPSELKKINVHTYTHTVNDQQLLDKLLSNSIDEVYTDYLPNHPNITK